MTNKVDWPRVDVRDYYLLMACLTSLRSTDAQTQCGCVITTIDNRTLGTGYNAFPRGLINERIPNTRPEKYPWVNSQHSERNAVNNCALTPKQLGGGIAYVTGKCCFDCTCHLWNNGVETIYELIGFNDPVMIQNTDNEDLKRQLQMEIMEGGRCLDIIKVTPEAIGKVFRKEQLVKILKLFATKGFDFDLHPDFEQMIFDKTVPESA